MRCEKMANFSDKHTEVLGHLNYFAENSSLLAGQDYESTENIANLKVRCILALRSVKILNQSVRRTKTFD